VLKKPCERSELMAEINAGVRESSRLYRQRNERRNAVRLLSRLSPEEDRVMGLAIEGIPNRKIAERLSISPRTVDRRRHSALKKLDAESVAEYAVLKTVARLSTR